MGSRGVLLKRVGGDIRAGLSGTQGPQRCPHDVDVPLHDGKELRVHGSRYVGSQGGERVDDFAGHDDGPWVNEECGRAKDIADGLGSTLQGLARTRIAGQNCGSQLSDIGDARALTQRRNGGQRLEATALAAGTGRVIATHRHVPQLPGQAARPANQAKIGDDTAAHAS